jgi:hypothetical protein
MEEKDLQEKLVNLKTDIYSEIIHDIMEGGINLDINEIIEIAFYYGYELGKQQTEEFDPNQTIYPHQYNWDAKNGKNNETSS